MLIQKEKELQNQILDYLSMCKGVVAWPNDSVGIWDPIRKIYRRNNNKHKRLGVSDILGCWNGRFLAIEVKTKVGRVSPEQKAFIKEINTTGGVAFVARSLIDVEAIFGINLRMKGAAWSL